MCIVNGKNPKNRLNKIRVLNKYILFFTDEEKMGNVLYEIRNSISADKNKGWNNKKHQLVQSLTSNGAGNVALFLIRVWHIKCLKT